MTATATSYVVLVGATLAVCAAGVGCDDGGGSMWADGGGGGAQGRRDGPAQAGGDAGSEARASADGPFVPRGISQLDLVFVIDNSASMGEEQQNLQRAFPAFMNLLQILPGGSPDLRIAIVSSNFGAGPTAPVENCPPYGDRGVFQVRAGCGLDPAASRWLAVDAMGRTNFAGDLATVFGCLARLGVNGCGYEHQLQALRAALTPEVTPENRGFLRPEAHLVIVILSDEDDCSGEPQSDLYENLVPGQAPSFRCSLTGHLCNGQAVPATPGFRVPLTSCSPVRHAETEEDRFSKLINVERFSEHIKALKPSREDKILVSAIIGWSDAVDAQYGVIERPATAERAREIDNMPICETANTGLAAPAIRLRAFATAFANHTIQPICSADLTPALMEVGRRLAGMMGTTAGQP